MKPRVGFKYSAQLPRAACFLPSSSSSAFCFCLLSRAGSNLVKTAFSEVFAKLVSEKDKPVSSAGASGHCYGKNKISFHQHLQERSLMPKGTLSLA